jgi:hypothetical protein
MRMWRRWRAERAGREHASAYVQSVLTEPAESDVHWLAETATGGDPDHARWELRYARRATGLLAAQRDALDDRTASLVSAALGRALRRDPRIAPERRAVAARQFNTRLAAYGDSLADKSGHERTGDRLGRVLLGFSGRLDPSLAELAAAGTVVAGYLADSSRALREAFGAAALPDDVAPSRIGARG